MGIKKSQLICQYYYQQAKTLVFIIDTMSYDNLEQKQLEIESDDWQ